MFASLCCLFLVLAGGGSAMYPPDSDIVNLTAANFDRLVIKSNMLYIVEFYAPWCGHCQSLVPEYIKAKQALRGVVKMGAVNAEEYKSISNRYGVSGYPTIKIFGSDKSKPKEYNGARTMQGIVDAALAAIKDKVETQMGGGDGKVKDERKKDSGSSKDDSKHVIELTDSNYDKLVLESSDMWLVEFYAPWCGHCQVLEPEWARAAKELHGKVKLGALDATKYPVTAKRYGVDGFPTIKMFAGGKKDSQSVTDYDGGRTASDIVNWATDKLAETLPAPEIQQLTDDVLMEDTCKGRNLCIVSVLPHILDCPAACRENYLATLNNVSEHHKRHMWGWLWVEAGAQPDLEAIFEIGGFGYPAITVVNPTKMKYSIFRGSFSYDGLKEFLKDLPHGRVATATIKGATLPAINPTAKWDGKDGVFPTEEDIDLSDVDIGETEDMRYGKDGKLTTGECADGKIKNVEECKGRELPVEDLSDVNIGKVKDVGGNEDGKLTAEKDNEPSDLVDKKDEL